MDTLNTQCKAAGGGGPPDGTGGGAGSGPGHHSNPPMDQEEEPREEEHPLQEEAIQAAMPAAVRPQAEPLHSSKEEQAIQATRHRHVQVYLIKGDIPIHGLHWTGPGKALPKLYPSITRIAAS